MNAQTQTQTSAVRAAIEAQRAAAIANARVNQPIQRDGHQANRRNPNQSDEPKPETKLYGNMIFCVPTDDPENEDGFVKVASLPYGLAIDTMNPMVEKRSDSAEFVANFIEPRNSLLGKVVELGFSTLEPGESRIVTPIPDMSDGQPFWAFELHRVKEKERVATANNVVNLIDAATF